MTREEKALIYFKDLRARKFKDYSSVFDTAPKDSVVYKAVSAEIEIYDTTIKALEQTELNPSYNSVKTELEQQSRWIPVSQGLPEDARNVLITVNPYGMVVPGWYSNESKLWYRLSQGRWAEVIDTECDVIAWQYFPEPYKEDSNGSES